MTRARGAARRSADMGLGDKDFAREALDGFFRRRGEAGKFYCAACLAQRLTQRGVGAFPPAAVKGASPFNRSSVSSATTVSRSSAVKPRRSNIASTRAKKAGFVVL